MMLAYPDKTHAAVLARFTGELYTPGMHNLMRKALEDAGVTGDLDQIVAAFANFDLRICKVVADAARAMR